MTFKFQYLLLFNLTNLNTEKKIIEFNLQGVKEHLTSNSQYEHMGEYLEVFVYIFKRYPDIIRECISGSEDILLMKIPRLREKTDQERDYAAFYSSILGIE